MLRFVAPELALAGMLAAMVPVLIHLLHRRRARTVHWAAMELLKNAVEGSRRTTRLRDLLLLALRSLALLLLGLALARPYFSSQQAGLAVNEPIHAIVVVDNSLSMGYQKLGGTSLDEARAAADDYLGRLPESSAISVIPLCGLARAASRDAYRTREDASEALRAIETVDRAGSLSRMVELARGAQQGTPEPRSKRVVFLTDLQATDWSSDDLEVLRELPDLQVVNVGEGHPENTWITSIEALDGIVDGSAPASVVVRVRHEGLSTRPGVQVSLEVDGLTVETQTIDLQPGQTREVRFAHRFDATAGGERTRFAALAAVLSPDRLPADDQLVRCVPVAAGLGIVFVDDLGEEEAPARGVVGETQRLRKLLSPLLEGNDQGKAGWQARLLRPQQVTPAALEGSHLVVVAGIGRPGALVPLLVDFVRRGGALLVAAGGNFDPAAWTAEGWLDGNGVLPCPLAREVEGPPAGAPGPDFTPWSLDPGSLAVEPFYPAGSSREELEEAYASARFLRAVIATSEGFPGGGGEAPADLRLLGAYSNGRPFLVARDLGAGTRVLLTTGFQGDWNTLTRSSAVLLLDRLARSLIERSFPRRNVAPAEVVVLPLEPALRRSSFALLRPGARGLPEPLLVEALGAESHGLILRDVLQRGLYRVSTTGSDPSAQQHLAAAGWSVSLAVNGPQRESELQPISRERIEPALARAGARLVEPPARISLEGARVAGEGTWRWLLHAAGLVLLVELALGAARGARRTARVPAAARTSPQGGGT